MPIISATSTHSATLIFLHGLGDCGQSWASILKNLVPSYCKLVCPNAPNIPVTLNMGMQMPAWFDIKGLTPQSPQDEAGIERGREAIEKLIDEEIQAGLSPNRIILGGFSMGGALALYTSLVTNRGQLGGVIALSSWMPLHQKIMANPAIVANKPKVFQGHGDIDMMVPKVMGVTTHQLLKQLGLNDSQFQSYPDVDHSCNDQELEHVRKFITEVVPSTQ